MKKVFANSAVGLLGVVLLLGSAATAESSDTRLAPPLPGAYSSGDTEEGSSFAGHVRTAMREHAAVGSFIQAANLPAFDTGPRSFDDLEAPGYRLPGSNVAGRHLFDAVDQSEVSGPAVGEPDALIMLLGAVGVVLYQLHRKQRSLEQRPLSL